MHISFYVENTYISNTDLESCWVSEESHNPKDLKFKINFFFCYFVFYKLYCFCGEGAEKTDDNNACGKYHL